MNTKLRIFGSLLTATMAWGAASQAGATILYNDWYAGTTRVGRLLATHSGDLYDDGTGRSLDYRGTGNQVILAGWTAQKWMPVLTNFTCAYWSTENCEAKLTFYANNGARYEPPAPGPEKPNEVLWTSDWFSAVSTMNPTNIGAIDLGKVIADNTPVIGDWPLALVPRTNIFTWALEFRGLSGTNLAGLYQMTTNGTTAGENYFKYAYWQQNFNDSWNTRTNTDGSFGGFAASFEGVDWVPEPSPVLYGAVLCGGVGFWMVRRRMQRPAVAK